MFHFIHQTCYIRLGISNHKICSLCRKLIRKVLNCDLCNMDILDKGYATIITRLQCNHVFHNNCIAESVSYNDNTIQVKCPKCDHISIKYK